MTTEYLEFKHQFDCWSSFGRKLAGVTLYLAELFGNRRWTGDVGESVDSLQADENIPDDVRDGGSDGLDLLLIDNDLTDLLGRLGEVTLS